MNRSTSTWLRIIETNLIKRNAENTLSIIEIRYLTWWCPVVTRHRLRSSINCRSVIQTGIRKRKALGRIWKEIRSLSIINLEFSETFFAWKITAFCLVFSFFINSSIDQIFRSFSLPPVPKNIRLNGLIRNRQISGPAFDSTYVTCIVESIRRISILLQTQEIHFSVDWSTKDHFPNM